MYNFDENDIILIDGHWFIAISLIDRIREADFKPKDQSE